MALALVLVAAIAAVPPPAPARWVEDQAAFLSPSARDALDTRLEAYQRATGHQVVVWVGKTLAGAALDDWAVRTFEAWKLGRRGLDDGLAMFVFADDRAIAIEVGYGLEHKVPDAIASRIIREVMAPRLRAGDRDGAVTAGTDAVLAAIEGRPWQGQPAAGREDRSDDRALDGQLVLSILGGLAVLILLVVRPRLALWLLWSILTGGRSGGRFGGGGFRGGGGRSGGGGARGGW